jgi:SHS2 domain-containing protein
VKTLLTALLAVSLAINAALLFIATSGARSHEAPLVRVASPIPQAPKLDRNVWPRLNSDDLPTMIARLRRVGFPPEVIQELVTARIDENFAARSRALDPDADTRPFWKTNSLDQKLQAALRQLDRDRQKALRDLLGTEADNNSPIGRVRWRREFASLPPAHAAEVRRIAEHYADLRAQSYSGGGTTPDEAAQRAALVQAERTAIAQTLSPEELEQYELHTSNTAATLRSWIGAFDATEGEFLATYRLMHEFDLRFPSSSTLSAAEVKERNDAYPQLNEQVKAALGPDRYAEFVRSRDDNYQRTSQLVTRLELPPDAVNQVYAVQQDLQQRARSVQMDRTLAPDDRNAQLTALAAEAQAKVTSVLGPRGYDAYKQYGGGWLRTLAPQPAPKN